MSLNDWLQWGAIALLVLFEVGRRRVLLPAIFQRLQDAEALSHEALRVAEDVSDSVENAGK